MRVRRWGSGRRRSKPRWQDNPELRVDVPAASALCDWSFRDELLPVVALHPNIGGFSRLEFLGDAILNLSIYTAASLCGAARDTAVRAVANDNLDVRINASPLVNQRRSGDVLEALVGAVHLDGGFPSAWTAALRVAADAAGVPADVQPPPVLPQVVLDQRAGAFVGSALLGAVVADWLCRREPLWTDNRYSSERSALLGTARLAGLARRHLSGLSANEGDPRCADVLQITAAQRFVDDGWDGGVQAAIEFGVLPS